MAGCRFRFVKIHNMCLTLKINMFFYTFNISTFNNNVFNERYTECNASCYRIVIADTVKEVNTCQPEVLRNTYFRSVYTDCSKSLFPP